MFGHVMDIDDISQFKVKLGTAQIDLIKGGILITVGSSVHFSTWIVVS